MAPRLNAQAYELLKAAVKQQTADTPAGLVQRSIVMKRIEKLRLQTGTPATVEELQQLVNDIVILSPEVMQQVARANGSSSPHRQKSSSTLWRNLKFGVATAGGLAVSLWLLNLPYPMIRWPVARAMPFVLLPSFISMDHHYRGAIAKTEQADQLVNQATDSEDFILGKTKVDEAQKHLDNLPVWFLGYYPQAYCSLFSCSWRFTFDEFEQARKAVARMDARLFQEQNALKHLTAADQTVKTAKQVYQQAQDSTQKQAAITQWQEGIDRMQQIAPETYAGKTAQTRLVAYERDLQAMAGVAASSSESGNLMAAAQNFADVAQQLRANKIPSVAEWEEIIKAWEQAISRVQEIDATKSDYPQAQKLLAQYQNHLSQARIGLQHEQESVQAFDNAQQLMQRYQAEAAQLSAGEAVSQRQAIIFQLQKVYLNSTVGSDAKQLLAFAEQQSQ